MGGFRFSQAILSGLSYREGCFQCVVMIAIFDQSLRSEKGIMQVDMVFVTVCQLTYEPVSPKG